MLRESVAVLVVLLIIYVGVGGRSGKARAAGGDARSALRGSALALLALGVAAAVASDDVGYAVLAGCGTEPGWVADMGPRLRGRFLSLLDVSDRFSPTCAPLFAAAERAVETDEHVFDTGLDHGLFYRPRGDWMDRLVQWANPTGATGGGA